MLDGCAYFYDISYATTTAMVDELAQQAHAFWGMQTPQDIEPWTYVYQLSKLKRVELRVQALVKVQTVKLANPATGSAEQPVGNPVFLKIEKTTPFYVNLVAPWAVGPSSQPRPVARSATSRTTRSSSLRRIPPATSICLTTV